MKVGAVLAAVKPCDPGDNHRHLGRTCMDRGREDADDDTVGVVCKELRFQHVDTSFGSFHSKLNQSLISQPPTKRQRVAFEILSTTDLFSYPETANFSMETAEPQSVRVEATDAF